MLYQAALRRADLLRNFYEVGERAVARTSPYAFVISRAQMDPGAARKMLELLSFGEVESGARERCVRRPAESATPEGSYIIRMQQPYSSYAKTLLERQHYPDLRLYPGGPPQRPYDVTAQTLPLLMGVATDTIDAPFSVASKPATSFEFELSTPRPQVGWPLGHRFLARGEQNLERRSEVFGAIPRPAISSPIVRRQASRWNWRARASGSTRAMCRPSTKAGRAGCSKTFGFAYQDVLNPDIDAGNLRQRFDVDRVSRSAGLANRERLRARHHAAGVHRRIEQEGRGQLEQLSPSRAARWCF